MNLLILLQMAADAMGDRIAISSGGGSTISYKQLFALSETAGTYVAGLQVDNVAFCGTNSLAFPLGLFAAAAAGRPFVPLNYRLPDDSLRKLAARTAPSLMLVDHGIGSRLTGIAGVNILSNAQLSEVRSDTANKNNAGVSDIAVLLFTSGTTGEPKAAVLRNSQLSSYVIESVDFMGAREDEAVLISVPPYHIAGVAALLTSLYAGRRIVQMPSFDPAHWVELVTSEKITHAMVVPTMLARILNVLASTGDRLPTLRHLSYGGGQMPIRVIEEAMGRLPHVDFVNAYGLTETSSTVAVLDPHEHRNAFQATKPEMRRRLASVGRPLPGVELEVRDADDARCRIGEVGEIWVKGSQISGEYIGRASSTRDGWLPTRDLGWFDGEGFLFLEGRLDDVIVKGGENISPGEIEDVIRSHGSVSDAAVVGRPDDEWGQQIVAFVVLRDPTSQPDIKAWVRERLRTVKVPEEIYFRAELPYNDMGKLSRKDLRAGLC